MVLTKIVVAFYILQQQKKKFFFDQKKSVKNAKITKWLNAYKGYANTYNIDILNSFNTKQQLKDTESAIRNSLIDLLSELRGFKLVITLVLEFKKLGSDDEIKCSSFNSNSKAETIIIESDIDDVFGLIYFTTILHTKFSWKRFLSDYWFRLRKVFQKTLILMTYFQ